MKQINKLGILILVLVLSLPVVFAHGEESFAEAELIIEEKTLCVELSNNQLELLGDYYMEQMHPGEAHEQMDEMMGGECSDSLQEMHIRMAQSFYCGDHEVMGGDMMNAIG